MTTTNDIQERIRTLAYLMWETAGRQHGLATDYWLAAERHVYDSMEAAGSKLFDAYEATAKAATKRTPRRKSKS